MMAEVKWTKEQQQVIDLRDRNLLVSAAAGSGKTAVLVERIIGLVTDPARPVDIDRLLVMTFTNAAADEMRERVGEAIERRLERSPRDANLQRQSTLVSYAKITTIDSFCMKLLREHFQELDIDPGFRIGDEGEMMLLKADVMRDLLEDCYGRGDERFFRFVDTYAMGKADGGLEDYILDVQQFSQSNPWPEEWIGRCRNELSLEEDGDFSKTGWMEFLLRDVRRQAKEFAGQIGEAIKAAEEPDGPQGYLPMLNEDLKNMEALDGVKTYGELLEGFGRLTFSKLAPVRAKTVSPEKKELAAACRNRVKDAVKKMKALYAPASPEQTALDLAACREPVLELLDLAEEFEARFSETKKEKNLVDFNDLEHFALRILTGNSPDHSPGPAADSLSRFYEEILVDEYQDSNLVQETLISCICRERFGHPNVFMVGDVKQSIYKFRLAKPELFLEKYESYSAKDGPYQKIELHKNFRSRAQVLSGINDLFYGIMTKGLGKIAYTEDAALNPGADYPDLPAGEDGKIEVLLLNTGSTTFLQMDDEKADYTAKEAEARLIASKIRRLTDPETGMKIWNGKAGQYEPLKRKDIVILLRSPSGWTEEFLNVLTDEGISAFAESRTGYFTAVEVETVLNVLALADNPMQDIPLAGVMKSPIGRFSDQELATVMAAFRRNPEKGQDRGLYAAVRYYLSLNKTNAVTEKLKALTELLADLRREAQYRPLHELIYRIFERTGYYDYVSAMPAGRTRRANLDMLVERAAAYEKTSYQGLFDFIRYIDRLKKYNTDFGEAALLGEDEDTVRIMSIHKSKGLEFPVVFLAGAGKQFNRQDARGRILIDETLGIATDFYDTELNLKAPTLKKNVLGRRMNLDNMGEELRILYVAMTRAKEKLIVTAADRYLENKLEKWGQTPVTGPSVPFTFLSAANSYLDWILMAAPRARESVCVETVPVEELLGEQLERQAAKTGAEIDLMAMRDEGKKALGETERERFDGLLRFTYPHQADVTLHAKMSVSELKERGQFVDDQESDFLQTIPAFLREEGTLETAPGKERPRTENEKPLDIFRGTAYHRVLELLPFARIESERDLKEQLELIRREGRMEEEALKLLDTETLMGVLDSKIGRRMRAADRAGKLYKERQFVMGIPARLMDEADSDEPVLIQGIIDAWMEEENGLVLIDYKTDFLRPGQETILLDRYRPQMIYYGQALAQITKKPVKEQVLYSLTLQKEIPVI